MDDKDVVLFLLVFGDSLFLWYDKRKNWASFLVALGTKREFYEICE